VLAGLDLCAVTLRAEVFFFDLADFFCGERIGCPQKFILARGVHFTATGKF
jgi:hypothetical protein